MRDYQERDGRPEGVKRAVQAIHAAAADGRVDDLRRLIDASPELLDARGVDRAGQTTLHRAAWNDRRDCVRLLLEYGVDVGIRDWGDNATALHGAAQRADVQVVRMLVEAGADVIGDGDDHQLGVLGWATCLGRVRDDIAAYLLGAGARLDIWSAIALGRAADVRRLVDADRSVLGARMSRNEHRRTPLHHAVVVNRADMVRLLIDLGADVHARDAAGNTALTLSALGAADAAVPAMLEQAGATLDLVAAVSLARYDVAERRLLDEPDTMALHVLVAARKPEAVRWLIEHGVDVNAKRVLWDCNCTALHITAEHGLVDVARMLLDAGADPSIHDDKYDATVLEWTHYCDQPRIAELLRSRGITA